MYSRGILVVAPHHQQSAKANLALQRNTIKKITTNTASSDWENPKKVCWELEPCATFSRNCARAASIKTINSWFSPKEWYFEQVVSYWPSINTWITHHKTPSRRMLQRLHPSPLSVIFKVKSKHKHLRLLKSWTRGHALTVFFTASSVLCEFSTA